MSGGTRSMAAEFEAQMELMRELMARDGTAIQELRAALIRSSVSGADFTAPLPPFPGITVAEAAGALRTIPPPSVTDLALLSRAVYVRALDVPRWRRRVTRWWRGKR